MAYKENNLPDNQYNSEEIENRCIAFWDAENIYAYDKNASRENTFCIDTPPPTVSGSLHIGHIFSFTQTDITARFQRMSGKSVFYPIGWDDNGLPTERRVQNYYNIACNPNLPYDPDFKPVHKEKDETKRKEVSRKNFIEACQMLTQEDEQIFEQVFRRIGHSYDWSLKYTTISPEAIKVSQKSFLDLYAKNKVVSIEAPTMWDVTFKSAVAQAEVEDREVEGFFHDIKFQVQGSDETFIISTTRPELLPACLAIVANPEDERYKKLFGKNAIVPLFDISVPILPAEHADKDKGTGIMMVCTFGDAADVAWWKNSGLPIKQIIGLDGRIIDVDYGVGPFSSLNPDKAKENFAKIKGMTVKQAKETIVALLRQDGALQGEPRKIIHSVKFYEKGSLPLEFVSSRQWFIKLLEEKNRMIDAGAKINWVPEHMYHRYEEWTKGLNQDWCISRQRFFGVPFPVWYHLDEKGNPDYNNPILASEKQLPVDPMSDTPIGFNEEQRNKPNGFIGDCDIMDTWATSSLTPQIAMYFAPKNVPLALPFDIRPQAHDIIRTWAFYTIAKALLHENKIPWKKILISGFILDPDRKKMSKSKGNVVTPLNLIEKHSSDAVRYWAAKARLGIDTAFEEQIMTQGRKLVVKLFNAAKFVLAIVANSNLASEKNYKTYIKNDLDKAWLAKLANTAKNAQKAFLNDDYASALDLTETRFWDFCDNYLEIVKKRAYSQDNNSAVASLMLSLDTFIKLFAPFCPFITEEIYQIRSWKDKQDISVHKEAFPDDASFENLVDNEQLYDEVVNIIAEIRKAKTNANKPLKTPVKSLQIYTTEAMKDLLLKNQTDIINVGQIENNGIIYIVADKLDVKNIVLDMNFISEKK